MDKKRKSWKKSNKKKEKILGMSLGKARNIMMKNLMFNLAGECGRDYCYRCGERIENVDEFSVDHKVGWQLNGKEHFFDVNNIAFSHLSCNITHCDRSRDHLRKVSTDGLFWCATCEDWHQRENMIKKKSKWHGLDCECKGCKSIRNKKRSKRV